MKIFAHPYQHSSHPGGRWLAAIAIAAMMLTAWANAAAAEDKNLRIELNKTVDSGGGCLASFVVENKLGHTLDRFSLDLFIFDKDGIIARQILLDMAPLRKAKTTVANFSLVPVSCDSIGKVLVNDIPSCRSEDGSLLDCLDDLKVSSRNRIELTK
jgi:hypothetical protein